MLRKSMSYSIYKCGCGEHQCLPKIAQENYSGNAACWAIDTSKGLAMQRTLGNFTGTSGSASWVCLVDLWDMTCEAATSIPHRSTTLLGRSGKASPSVRCGKKEGQVPGTLKDTAPKDLHGFTLIQSWILMAMHLYDWSSKNVGFLTSPQTRKGSLSTWSSRPKVHLQSPREPT